MYSSYNFLSHKSRRKKNSVWRTIIGSETSYHGAETKWPRKTPWATAACYCCRVTLWLTASVKTHPRRLGVITLTINWTNSSRGLGVNFLPAKGFKRGPPHCVETTFLIAIVG